MPQHNPPSRIPWRREPGRSSQQTQHPPSDAGDGLSAGPLFQGTRFDPKASAIYERPRPYSPTLKAWIDQEPIAYVDGLNAYVVEGDNPINAVNPLGE